MKETKQNELVSIVYMSFLSATIVATLITKSPLVFIGGLVGTVVVVKLLVKSGF